MLLLVAVLITSGTLWAQGNPSPDALLRAAEQLEQVDGDIGGALSAYQALVDRHPTHRSAGRALLRIAAIRTRQGEVAVARAALRRVIAAFPAEKAAAEQALSRLPGPSTSTDRRVEGIENARMAADASISSDGRYLSYIDQATGELAVRDLSTGRVRQVTNLKDKKGHVEYSAVSGDGRWIAYVARPGGVKEERALWLSPLNAAASTQPRPLLAGQWAAPRQWLLPSRTI